MLRQKHCFNKWILYSVHKHFNFTPFIQDTMQYMWLEGSLLALRTFFSHVFIHSHSIFLFFRCLKLILYNLLKNWQFKSWFSNHSIYIFCDIRKMTEKFIVCTFCIHNDHPNKKKTTTTSEKIKSKRCIALVGILCSAAGFYVYNIVFLQFFVSFSRIQNLLFPGFR